MREHLKFRFQRIRYEQMSEMLDFAPIFFHYFRRFRALATGLAVYVVKGGYLVRFSNAKMSRWGVRGFDRLVGVLTM